jgi:hypothetical protein
MYLVSILSENGVLSSFKSCRQTHGFVWHYRRRYIARCTNSSLNGTILSAVVEAQPPMHKHFVLGINLLVSRTLHAQRSRIKEQTAACRLSLILPRALRYFRCVVRRCLSQSKSNNRKGSTCLPVQSINSRGTSDLCSWSFTSIRSSFNVSDRNDYWKFGATSILYRPC